MRDPEHAAEANRPTISVVIIAFQSEHIIEKAIKSTGNCHEVICWDNSSSDEVGELLCGRDVVYVRNGDNLGYARACNRAGEIATGDFLLFMNPDVELAPGALEAFMEAVARYPDTDVFVPRTVKGDGKPWHRDVTKYEHAREPPTVRLKGDVVGDCNVRFVDGGVFLIRRSTFQSVGGFDENIFLYFEDDDLSLRLLAGGHRIVYVHDALATHRIGTSSRPIGRYLVRKEFHKKRSEIYFNAKYGIETSIKREILAETGKVIFYSLTLRRRRTLSAYGRLRGALSLWGESKDAMPRETPANGPTG